MWCCRCRTRYESWGDAEPATGVVNVIQPAIQPLFDTASDGDVLLRIMVATAVRPRAPLTSST